MEDHRNARFVEADFNGARFRGVDFSNVKVTVRGNDLNRSVLSPHGGMTSVRACFHVVFREEWWHNQYATRDLAVLTDR